MGFRFAVRLLVAALLCGVLFTGTAEAAPSQIMITQVRTDGANTASAAPKEYVELYNASGAAINLAGWTVEYARSAAKLTAQSCVATSWVVIDPSTNVKEVALSGKLAAKASVKVAFAGLIDDRAGSIRVVQPPTKASPTSVVHDMVGWGSKTEPADCAEAAQAAIPLTAQRLARCVSAGAPSDTNNNAKDFVIRTDAQATAPACAVPVPAKPPTTPTASCKGVQMSEIMANPTGDDTGKEYIELYNPSSQAQSLQGCSLKGSASKTFALPAEQLAPGAYKTFYSQQTGLTLTNNGGTATLITATEELVIEYPALNDDQTWALVGDKWAVTTLATPNQVNVLLEAGRVVGDEEVQLKPCSPGKFRNPLTNRCKNIVTNAGALTPCKPGQTRNPVTNRCKSIVLAATATLVPCKAGQARNPATNRCRSVVTATATLKPCDEGEERNPETNRCRKVNGETLGASTAPAAGVAQEKKMPTVSFAILGSVLAVSTGYMAYEYRTDIRNKLARVKARLTKDGT